MTLAGLNTVNLSALNTFQQIILFVLIMLGSAIFVSIGVVHVRKKAFERRFKSIVEEARQRRRARSGTRRRLSFGNSFSRSRPEVDGLVVRGRAIESEKQSSEYLNGTAVDGGQDLPPADRQISSTSGNNANQEATEENGPANAKSNDTGAAQALSIDSGPVRRITFASPSSLTRERLHNRIFSMQGVGARQNIENHPTKTGRPIYLNDLPRIDETHLDNSAPDPPHHGLLSGGFIGRNSQFSSLTLAERERLGGVEYRAVSILAVVVPLYFVLWQLLGCIGLGAYIAINRQDTTTANGLNPWYGGIVMYLVHFIWSVDTYAGGQAPLMGSRLSITVVCLCWMLTW